MRRWWIALALVVGFSVPASAQLQWQATDYFNLTGGLNDGSDPTALESSEASDLQNIVITLNGALKKRQGFAAINSTAVATGAVFTGIAPYTQADGTRFLVSTISNGATDTIQSMPYGSGSSGPTGTWTNRTGALSLSFADDQLSDFCVAQNNIVIADGVGTHAPYVWSGSGNATALGGAPPNASMCEYHKNLLFLAGDSSNPSRLTFSNIGDITTWTGTDFITIETNDGQQIRALKSALDCLYAFKDFSIWRVCGTSRDDLTSEQMVNGVGTLSNQSVQLLNNVFYFVTSRGEIASYDGGINVSIISNKIQTTLTNFNFARFAKAVSTVFNDGNGIDNYYLSMSSAGAGTHDTVLQYNPIFKSWFKHKGLNANALATYETGTIKKAIVFGDYAGRINQYPTTNADAGVAINAYYQSGQLRFPDIPQEKIFRLAQVFVNQEGNYNLTFEHRLDFDATGKATSLSLNGTGASWDSATWDSSRYADLTTVIGRVEINQGYDFFQWKVSNANVSEPFTLKGVRLWAEPTQRIGGIR